MRSIVSVIGKDKVGIIASVCTLLSENNINILDISQTILNDNFTMIMIVDTGKSIIPFDEIREKLKDRGNEMGLSIHIQREDIFEAMHRI